jgi:hypothetical protein
LSQEKSRFNLFNCLTTSNQNFETNQENLKTLRPLSIIQPSNLDDVEYSGCKSITLNNKYSYKLSFNVSHSNVLTMGEEFSNFLDIIYLFLLAGDELLA